MAVDPKEFELEYFKKNGFIRQKCKVCGTYFWSQRISDVCGESPCVENTFIGNTPTTLHLDLNGVRETFLNFFNKNGHTIIEPYPVVCRWRDDLLVTIASIVDFQPYVTNGEIPPPANPLVVSQPCLRFEDIDNVGVTSGRHLTIFEMGGAHAFNYPEKEVYWKDKTVEYHHELITKVFGVKSEKISYKEHLWSGGGNAGPAVEAIVDGLEISTLVFMCYKMENGYWVPTIVRTVDTGYGLERWAWLSLGTPTAFHAIFGPLLPKFMEVMGVECENRVLIETGKLSGALNVEKPNLSNQTREMVAKRLGFLVDEYMRRIEPFEKVCTVLDHTKALIFLLAEGVVPSNVKTGYLARMLLRRIYRILYEFRCENQLLELLEYQIDYWGKFFRNIEINRNEILKLAQIEVEKYRRTLEREMETLVKKLNSLRKEGKREVPREVIVEAYESHGIHPMQLKEQAMKLGLITSIPQDFFSSIVKMHTRKTAEIKEKNELETIFLEKKIPPTEKLFYEDPKLLQFKAKTIHVHNNYIVLDRTAFYAESGGQLSDSGKITWKDGECVVKYVKKIGGIIVHEIEGTIPPLNTEITGYVDKERREQLSIHHTATHIINGAARKVLGEHVWQAGAQKDVKEARLDITHYTNITEEEVKRIEEIANEIVRKNIQVEIYNLPRLEAEKRYGYRLYQGGVVPGKEIRVIKIGDHDVEACGGTHVSNTGEIGFIKVVKVEHIQDGVERIVFVAGKAALEKVQEAFGILKDISRKMQTPSEKVVESVEKMIKENEEIRRKVKKYSKRLSEYSLPYIKEKAEILSGIRLYYVVNNDLDESTHIEIGSTAIEEIQNLLYCALIPLNNVVQVVVFSGKQAQEKGISAKDVANFVAKILDGAAGGDKRFGRGGGRNIDKLNLIKDKLIEYLKDKRCE
ncbi:MAG: alanine--tRNA ligase [Nitrososphaeria archaeon]